MPITEEDVRIAVRLALSLLEQHRAELIEEAAAASKDALTVAILTEQAALVARHENSLRSALRKGMN